MPERAHDCDCHPFEVWLDADEKRWADAIGRERYRRSIQRRSRDVGGRNEASSHTFGARAELAAALVLGIEWPARIDTFTRLPDIDPDLEIRGSHGGLDLKMREKDMEGPSAARRFVVVVYRDVLETWRVTGWLWGYEAARMKLKPESRRRDLAPAMWVPAPRLHAPALLVELQR